MVSVWVLILLLQIKTGYGYTAQVIGSFHTEEQCQNIRTQILMQTKLHTTSNVISLCTEVLK